MIGWEWVLAFGVIGIVGAIIVDARNKKVYGTRRASEIRKIRREQGRQPEGDESRED